MEKSISMIPLILSAQHINHCCLFLLLICGDTQCFAKYSAHLHGNSTIFAYVPLATISGDLRAQLSEISYILSWLHTGILLQEKMH